MSVAEGATTDPDPSTFATPSRRRQAYKDLVITSLVPSHSLQSASTQSSQAARREGTHVMKFARDWQSSNCPVNRWYQAQLTYSKENGSTTRFSVVQHRRTLDYPFFHEFLIMPLADGSYYRLERTGVGSNTDAITRFGCPARDLVAWFPRNQDEPDNRDKGSALVAEVGFPSELDILDVLAVCYSIQKQPRARRYTLQCYNCYFFCCTILSILGRRSVDWESMVPSIGLLQLRLQLFDNMNNLSNSPEAKRYSALRVCSTLKPQDPSAGKPVTGGLVDGLSKVGQDSFQQILGEVFWLHGCRIQLRRKLEIFLWDSTRQICSELVGSDSIENDLEKRNGYTLVKGVYMREKETAAVKYHTGFLEQVRLFNYRKHQASLHARLLAGLFGPPSGFVLGLKWGFSDTKLHGFNKLAFALKLACSASQTGSLFLLLARRNDFQKHVVLRATDLADSLADEFLRNVFNTFESDERISMEEASALIVKLIAQDEKDQGALRYSGEALLLDNLEELLKAEARSRGDLITLVCGDANAQDRALTDQAHDVSTKQQGDGQDHIRTHVKRYADRVERNYLDSSVLVCRDVEEAISEEEN
ncbi:hypothetical protein FRC06_005663 [Ceratobasidium sp. 370]|nr:hypothetical protein FRC06_005663 [Ceratobasidium sp. 370]